MEKLTKKQAEVLTVIKKYIASNGYSPTVRELCEEVGLSSTATAFVHIKHLINKGYISQTNSKFRTLSLNVSNEFKEVNEDVIEVPLLGRVAAGNPIEAIANPTEFISLPSYLVPKKKDIFTLEIKGDSMEDIGIFDKDLVIVKRESSANNGELVVALDDDGGATLKRFFKDKEHFRLEAENKKYNPIILSSVTILGKPVGLYRKI